MLHIVRKKGESITIDGGITIRVIDVENHQVRIGIEAPREIGVYRHELYEKIRQENALALESAFDFEALDMLSKERSNGV